MTPSAASADAIARFFFEDASLRSLNDLDTGAKHAFITLAGRDARVRGDTHINIGNGAKFFSDNSLLVKLALRIFPDSAPDEIGKAFMAGGLFAWTVGAAWIVWLQAG